eukprot:TRINITY_DN9874_c0_g1_i1.p1 TRINITY_DN9874_c0_g1~~TRINITY_DN9874_c0_g1_i1.p1  ORF type:complete len:133 (-),score=7.31 TRINITY_DN9874_c0_g1_i1:66-464(-)
MQTAIHLLSDPNVAFGLDWLVDLLSFLLFSLLSSIPAFSYLFSKTLNFVVNKAIEQLKRNRTDDFNPALFPQELLQVLTKPLNLIRVLAYLVTAVFIYYFGYEGVSAWVYGSFIYRLVMKGLKLGSEQAGIN